MTDFQSIKQMEIFFLHIMEPVMIHPVLDVSQMSN